MSGDKYRIADQEQLYFLTFTIVHWIDVFTRKEQKLIITDALNYCIENKGLEVFAWVLMSNHLHLIARATKGYELYCLALVCNGGGREWRFLRQLSSKKKFIVQYPHEYLFSSAKDYNDDLGIVKITKIEQ